MVIADDLHIGETRGYRVHDSTRLAGDPDQIFFLKVILLFVQGDYPAQAKCSGMTHAGRYCCHWCLFQATYSSGIHRVVCGNYAHFLPAQNHSRPRGSVTPPIRTHSATCRDAARAQSARDQRLNNPNDDLRGAKEWCPLAVLGLFDVIWDFVPDMMHIVYNTMKEYIVKTMKGLRKIKTPKLLILEEKENCTNDLQRGERKARKERNNVTMQEYRDANKVLI